MTRRLVRGRILVSVLGALLFAALHPAMICARSINDGTGRTSFTWLKAFSDAGISATGETFAARDGITGLLVHPAAIAGIDGRTVKMNYASYYLDTQFGTVGYTQKYRDRYVGIRVSYMNYGEFQGRTVDNQSTGTFSAGDVGLTVNVGQMLRDDLKVGLMATWLTSRIDDFSAQAASVDIGALYYPPFEGLTVGAALMNMGKVLDNYSGGYEETMPVYLNVGVRKTLAHAPITLFSDVQFPNDEDIAYSYGIEVTVRNMLFLRAGTKSRSEIDREELKATTDFAARTMFGFGLVLKSYQFSYAFCPNDDLGDTHKVTLSAGFSR